MVLRERITLAVLAGLLLSGVWFAALVLNRGIGADLTRPMLALLLVFVGAVSVGAAIAALVGRREHRADERDGIVAGRAQMLRGYCYLVLAFGLFAFAVASGQHALANGLLLTIIAIETMSGLAMLVIYRRNA